MRLLKNIFSFFLFLFSFNLSSQVLPWDTIEIGGFGSGSRVFQKIKEYNTRMYVGATGVVGAEIYSSPTAAPSSWAADLGFAGVKVANDNGISISIPYSNTSLFAWTSNGVNGSCLYAYNNTSWSSIASPPFSNSPLQYYTDATAAIAYAAGGINDSIFVAYKNTNTGCEIWKMSATNPGLGWQMSKQFSTAGQSQVNDMAVFNNNLYVITDSSDLWQYNGTNWTEMVNAHNSFNFLSNTKMISMEVYAGQLYIGTQNATNGSQLWTSANGSGWSVVNFDGFTNNANLDQLNDIVSANGLLWISANGPIGSINRISSQGNNETMNGGSGPVIYSSNDGTNFSRVSPVQFNDINNVGVYNLCPFGNDIYAAGNNVFTGGKIYKAPFAPTSNFFAGTLTPCVNANVVFTNTSLVYDSVTWFVNSTPQNSFNGNYDMNYTFTANATYTVSCLAWNGLAKDSTWVFLPVTSPQVLLTGPTSYCQNDSAFQQSNPFSGTPPYTFSWNGSLGNYTTQDLAIQVASSTVVYTVTVTDANGCSVTDFAGLFVNSWQNITGSYSWSSGPVNNGNVYLIKQGSASALYDTVAVAPLSAGGSYTFSAAPNGNYYLRAEPDTSVYSTLINTYYGNEYLWDSATVFAHSCFTATNFVDVLSQELPGLTGPCSIHGTVYEGSGFGQKLILGPVGVMTNVIPGVPVKVGKNPGGSIVQTGLTDINGEYNFNNLPYDSYKIYTDIPGYPMDSSYAVVLSASTDSLINLDYFVDSNSVYINLITTIHFFPKKNASFLIYPNPASSLVTIKTSELQNSNGTFKISDLSGRTVYSSKENSIQSNSSFIFDFSTLEISSGTYLFEISGIAEKIKIVYIKN